MLEMIFDNNFLKSKWCINLAAVIKTKTQDL